MADDEKETCQKTFSFINGNVKVPHIHIHTQASRLADIKGRDTKWL